MNFITKIYDWIINLIFPIKCLGCGLSDTMLCEQCLSTVRRSTPISDPNIIAVSSYKDRLIKKALWLLKFHNRQIVAKSFGKQMYDELITELSDRTTFEHFINPLIIPAPISRKRLHDRGYNQALLLAIEIAKHSGGSFVVESNALKKIQETDRQAMIKERTKRLNNLRGSFRADQHKVRGRNIIFVDDIVTSGATITEARRALKKAGARKILAVTVAH